MEQIPPAAGAAGAAGAAAQGPASTAAAGAAASTQATAGATLPVVTQGPASVDASANEKLIEEARAAARARLLKELGFEKVDDAKGALSKAREIADAQLTEKDRLTKQLEELTPKAKRAEAADAVAGICLALNEGKSDGKFYRAREYKRNTPPSRTAHAPVRDVCRADQSRVRPDPPCEYATC